MKRDIAYYASERFIHDDMLAEAEAGLKDAIHQSWKVKGRIDPFIISWVQQNIPADDGSIITNHVVADMSEDRSGWTNRMVHIIKKTKPYALMLCEQRETEVVAIFESRHGTRSWRYPIKMHGRTAVLGEPSTRDDIDSIGLLWRATKAIA